MLKHLALDEGAYDLKMNVRQLAPDCIIDVDPAEYARELALKDEILAEDYDYYYQALPGTEAMQWETIEILLPNMAQFYPEHFALTTDGDRWRWTNRLLGTETAFTLGDPATLPLPPLDWVGRQVQEDLCVMDGNDPGSPLVAGHLCFASGWCLDDKMGQSFLAIHGPVPLFAEKIGRPADLMMQRVKVGRVTARVNWTIHPSDRLNCAPVMKQRYAHEHDGHHAGERGRAILPPLRVADPRPLPAHQRRPLHDPHPRHAPRGSPLPTPTTPAASRPCCARCRPPCSPTRA